MKKRQSIRTENQKKGKKNAAIATSPNDAPNDKSIWEQVDRAELINFYAYWLGKAVANAPPGRQAAKQAYNSLTDLLKTINVAAIEVSNEYPPSIWLWLLRRLPPVALSLENSAADSYMATRIAEIISGHSVRKPKEDDFIERNGAIYVNPQKFARTALLSVCAAAICLRKIHRLTRTAGKGVDFLFGPSHLPVPEPTPEQAAALSYYDSRPRPDLLTEYCGTILEFSKDPDSSFFIVNRAAFGSCQLDSGRKLGQRFVPIPLRPLDIEEIGGFERPEDSGNAALSFTAARWASECAIKHHNSKKLEGTAGKYGYIVMRARGADLSKDNYDKLYREAIEKYPQQDIPDTFDKWIDRLSAPDSLWPLGAGPLVRVMGSRSYMIDLDSIGKKFEQSHRIAPKNASSERGTQFELVVQDLIDTSPWRIEETSKFYGLRGKTIRRKDGSALTDIDAIGQNGDTILVVSCKSMPRAIDHHTGNHRIARNLSCRIEQYCKEALLKRAELLDSEKFAGVNIIMTVCTALPIYSDPLLCRRPDATPEKSAFVSTTLVAHGLALHCTLAELRTWLASPKDVSPVAHA